jgi:predicted small integral membrane protein
VPANVPKGETLTSRSKVSGYQSDRRPGATGGLSQTEPLKEKENMFAWMAWTLPVAVFFICIVLMLAGMTMWEIKSPTTLRKGFLPIATTRGDRLFIGLLAAAYVNLAFVALSEKMIDWFSLASEPSIWISFIVSMLLLVFILRKG